MIFCDSSHATNATVDQHFSIQIVQSINHFKFTLMQQLICVSNIYSDMFVTHILIFHAWIFLLFLKMRRYVRRVRNYDRFLISRRKHSFRCSVNENDITTRRSICIMYIYYRHLIEAWTFHSFLFFWFSLFAGSCMLYVEVISVKVFFLYESVKQYNPSFVLQSRRFYTFIFKREREGEKIEKKKMFDSKTTTME